MKIRDRISSPEEHPDVPVRPHIGRHSQALDQMLVREVLLETTTPEAQPETAAPEVLPETTAPVINEWGGQRPLTAWPPVEG